MDESPLIRRKQEADSLMSAFRNMESGTFQIRFINGEAGSGKSTLVSMFADEITPIVQKTIIITGFCNLPSDYNMPYQPFKDLMKQLFEEVKRLQEDNPNKKEMLKNAFAFSARILLKYAPDLIGSLIPGGSIIKDISQSILDESKLVERLNKKTESGSEQIDESKIAEQFIDFIKAFTEEYRLILIIDDLQWIDTPSVNLLYQLVVSLHHYPVMFIGCYRSSDVDINLNGGKHPLDKLINEVKISHGNVFIQLDNLDEERRRLFMNEILDNGPNLFDQDFRNRLFERTNGNPLFVNELIILFKEENEIVQNNEGVWMNSARLDWQAYPMKIEGIIKERIGRLEDSLIEILSHASVQGHHFIAQVLSKTINEPEKELLINLSKKLQKQHHLITEGSCTRMKMTLVTHFYFSNYIFQQYLYQELSMTERMLLHGDIAVILEEMYKENIEEVAGDIAHHYEMAGEYDKAVEYMEITADNMMRVSAFKEAIPVLQNAVGHIKEQCGEEKQILYRLVIRLCICYRSVKGWGNEETIQMFGDAQKLRDETGNNGYNEILAFGLWAIGMTQLNFKECIAIINRFLESTDKEGDIKYRQIAYISLINTYFWMGDFLKAKELLDFLEATFSEQELPLQDRAFYYFLSVNIYFQIGLIERCDFLCEKMLSEYADITDSFSQVVVWQSVAWYYFLCNNLDRCREYAKKIIDKSVKYSFNFYLCIGKMLLGASTIETPSLAIEYIRDGYNSLLDKKNGRNTLSHSLYKLILGTIYLKSEQFDLCLDMLKDTIPECIAVDENCYLAELYILQGKCHYEQRNIDAAIYSLRQAVEIAQRNGSFYPLKQAQELLSNFK